MKWQKLITALVVLLMISLIAVSGQQQNLSNNDHSSSSRPLNRLTMSNEDLDSSTSPCQDFYQYANGGWLAKNPLPAAYREWGVADQLAEEQQQILREVLEAAAKNPAAARGSNEQKVGDFYASCMDEAQIEAAGLKPLQPELARIDKLTDIHDLPEAIAHLHDIGINPLFLSDSKQDAKNSGEVIFEIWQGGLGLPEGDYYSSEDNKSIRAEYLKHVAKMFELLGDNTETALKEAETVMKIESRLAIAWMPRVERRKPQNVYHRITLAQLAQLTPNFSWTNYLKSIGLNITTDINVGQPKFFLMIDLLAATVPIADWRVYLRWHLVHGAAPALPAKFVEEDFNFRGRVLTGTTEILPRWKRCAETTDRVLGEALGEVYVRRTFPPAAKARAVEMVENLTAALKQDFTTLNWMSDATRKEAIAKLDGFINKIGYPDHWRDYTALTLDRSSYLANRFRADQFENRRDQARVGKPLDKGEWLLTPTAVNAYYNSTINEIVFPAAILQPPFFDPAVDDAVNYGAIGAVIGHEMMHGFDDQGSQFDAKGNLRNWWTEADLKNFQARAQCVIDQFSAYEVEKNLNINGKLVAGESIADLGGLVIAYAAFQHSLIGKPKPAKINGFTAEQRFFLSYAHIWATNQRAEFMRLQTKTDPHPLPKFRTNGPVSNMPEFAEAFGCKPPDGMVRSERCRIW